MAPPELPRDTPVAEMIDPVFECLVESLWNNFEFSFFVSCYDLVCHSACSDEPLGRYNRLDTTLATRAESYGMRIWLDAHEIALGPEELDDIVTSLTYCSESHK